MKDKPRNNTLTQIITCFYVGLKKVGYVLAGAWTRGQTPRSRAFNVNKRIITLRCVCGNFHFDDTAAARPNISQNTPWPTSVCRTRLKANPLPSIVAIGYYEGVSFNLTSDALYISRRASVIKAHNTLQTLKRNYAFYGRRQRFFILFYDWIKRSSLRICCQSHSLINIQ